MADLHLDSATSLFGALSRRLVLLSELLESSSLGSESSPPDLRERGRRRVLGRSSSPQCFPSQSTLPLPLPQHLHIPTPRPVSNLCQVMRPRLVRLRRPPLLGQRPPSKVLPNT